MLVRVVALCGTRRNDVTVLPSSVPCSLLSPSVRHAKPATTGLRPLPQFLYCFGYMDRLTAVRSLSHYQRLSARELLALDVLSEECADDTVFCAKVLEALDQIIGDIICIRARTLRSVTR